ncbi:MAG: CvpA family protein [Ignavibacteria bacterium]
MNWLDIVIAVIIALSAVLGFRKGFLRKVLGIMGIILGFVLAVRFYKPISEFAGGTIKSGASWIPVLSFLLVIGVVFSLAVWVARFIAGLNSGTAKIDKLLGLVFGFLQGLIISSVLAVNLSLINYPDTETRNSSRLYPLVYNVAPYLFEKVLNLSPNLKTLYDEYKNILKPK